MLHFSNVVCVLMSSECWWRETQRKKYRWSTRMWFVGRGFMNWSEPSTQNTWETFRRCLSSDLKGLKFRRKLKTKLTQNMPLQFNQPIGEWLHQQTLVCSNVKQLCLKMLTINHAIIHSVEHAIFALALVSCACVVLLDASHPTHTFNNTFASRREIIHHFRLTKLMSPGTRRQPRVRHLGRVGTRRQWECGCHSYNYQKRCLSQQCFTIFETIEFKCGPANRNGAISSLIACISRLHFSLFAPIMSPEFIYDHTTQ